MMLPESATQRIEALSASSDPVDRAVARRLSGQLPRAKTVTAESGAEVRSRSRWAHVDLTLLLGSFGNPVGVAGERLKSSHEPVHGSRSGTCLVAWPETGRWWCSSCGRSGDAAGYVMLALGLKYPAAADWLSERFGPPARESGGTRTGSQARSRQRPYDAGVRRVVLRGGSGA